MIKFTRRMNKESITQELVKLGGQEKRISCTEARKLAERQGVGALEVGRLCDSLGIKIFACELGCF